jgi:queuine tRNA-ribosyltransferase
MPCATKGSVKCITPQDLSEIGTGAWISNSLVLSLNPGVDIVEKVGGLHRFSGFDGVIFTDSGGFQADRESFYVKSQEDGIVFTNPWHGNKFLYTPKDAMQVQQALGSDVAMCLDDMPSVKAGKKDVEKSLDRTHRWAEECLQYKIKKQKIFGICQGGLHLDVRKKSAQFIDSLDFDGVAIGGLALGEGHAKMVKAMQTSIKELDDSKIRYLMGVGNPADIVEAVGAGVDCFDSAYHTQNARHGTLFTSKGKIRIKNAAFRTDSKALDKDCDCYVCKNFSRAFLSYQMRMNEPTGYRLCSYHNLYFMQRLMDSIREGIEKGSFEKVRKDIGKKFG